MKGNLRKVISTLITILTIISHSILIWLVISTVEIIFKNTTDNKPQQYNIFALSSNINYKNNM